MSEKTAPFQPGAMLHDAIFGAFRASGGSCERWCTENKVTPTNARNATYGIMKGARGKELLARLIEAAGPEVARAGYGARLRDHAATFRGAA